MHFCVVHVTKRLLHACGSLHCMNVSGGMRPAWAEVLIVDWVSVTDCRATQSIKIHTNAHTAI